jgi:ABC-type lipoprotein release transport system permease subunit
MLFKIAWRNIWRSKMRTAVLILSIGFGLWAGIFSMGLMRGSTDQRTRTAIETYVSHIQIHNPDYQVERSAEFDIAEPERVTTFLDTVGAMSAYTQRMLLGAMASTAQGATGVQVLGIDPSAEKRVTNIFNKVVEGSYFESDRRNPIVLGHKLAHKLEVKLGSKVVLTFQDRAGDLTAGAFRIVGIFRTANSVWDETTVFVRRSDLAKVFGEERIHEIAILLADLDASEPVNDSIANQFPDLKSETWGQVSPELGYTNDVLDQTMYIFVLIILLAMAFGIVNSMLMAVLERRHELGMLLCVGMSKSRVFGMVVLETIFIAGVGGPLGLLLALLTISHLGRTGIDLSIIEEALATYGMETVVYPALGASYYLNITIMVIVTAIVSALYPARRAVKYDPAEAVRAI